MSDTSDVKLLTLNQKTVFNTSAAIERVKIHNNSSFFLRVYFGADAPVSATDQGWHDTIDPGGTPLMAIVGASSQVFTNRTYIQSTPYQGVITIMPFLPVGAQLVAGGIISGAALCYLTGYYPDEWAEQGGEIEAFVQAAKQARNQAVIGGVTSVCRLTMDETITEAHNILRNIGGSPLAPNLYTANAAGGSFCNVYVYGMTAYMETRSPAHSGVEFDIALVVADSVFGVQRGITSLGQRFMLESINFGTDKIELAFPSPLVISIGITQNQLAQTDALWVEYNPLIGTLHGSYLLRLSFWAVLDTINQSVDSAISGFGDTLINPPWALYNPQTY